MIERFDTERLRATRLAASDLSELSRMHDDVQLMATLGGTRTEARTRQFLHTNLEHWHEHGFGLWMFRTTNGAFVGRGGLRRVQIAGCDEVEIAYALMPAYWGRGLATEIARALVDIAFEQLAIPALVTYTLRTNLASRRVMEKAGFTYERELIHGALGLPHVLYRLARAR